VPLALGDAVSNAGHVLAPCSRSGTAGRGQSQTACKVRWLPCVPGTKQLLQVSQKRWYLPL